MYIPRAFKKGIHATTVITVFTTSHVMLVLKYIRVYIFKYSMLAYLIIIARGMHAHNNNVIYHHAIYNVRTYIYLN